GPPPGDDRPAAAGAGDADAVHGPGVRLLQPIPLLRRPPPGAGPPRRPGAGRFPLPVPERRHAAGPGGDTRPRPPEDLRALQAGPPGARPPRRSVRAAPRPPPAAARGPRVPLAAPGRRGRGGAGGGGVRAAVLRRGRGRRPTRGVAAPTRGVA